MIIIMEIIRKARGYDIQRNQQRVFLSWSIGDEPARETIISDLLSHDAGTDCVVSWLEVPNHDIDGDELEQELRETQMLVLIVSKAFLDTPQQWQPPEYRIAKQINLPVLPIALDPALFPQFTSQEGAIHGISLTDPEYRVKLKVQLDNFLISLDIIGNLTGEIIINPGQASESSAARIMRELENTFKGSVFLSYRKMDVALARTFMHGFHNVPRFEAIAVWYDNFLTAGRVFDDEIRDAINKADVFLLLVTPNITQDGNYVLTEEYPYAVRLKKRIIAVEAAPTNYKEFRANFRHVDKYVKIGDLEKGFRSYLPDGRLTTLNADRKYWLGVAFMLGLMVEKDAERTVKLFETCAGDYSDTSAYLAITQLIKIYQLGLGIRPDIQKVLHWLLKTEDFVRQTHREDSELAMSAYHRIGIIYRELGRHESAVEYFEKALAYAQRHNRAQNVAEIRGDMTNLYADMGDLSKREELLEKNQNAFDSGSLETAIVYSQKADLADDRKEYGQALEFYKKSLEIRLARQGEAHPDTVNVYCNMAVTHQHAGQYDKALELYQKALAVREQTLGYSHPDTGISLYNIGSLFLEQKKWNEAAEYFDKAHRVFLQYYGAEHERSVTAFKAAAYANGQSMKNFFNPR